MASQTISDKQFSLFVISFNQPCHVFGRLMSRRLLPPVCVISNIYIWHLNRRLQCHACSRSRMGSLHPHSTSLLLIVSLFMYTISLLCSVSRSRLFCARVPTLVDGRHILLQDGGTAQHVQLYGIQPSHRDHQGI